MPQLRKETSVKQDTEQQSWVILPPLRPGETPLQALEDSWKTSSLSVNSQTFSEGLSFWTQKHPDTRILLFIDQSEEVITLCKGESDRTDFFQTILQAIANHPTILRVVLSLRADFEPQVRESVLTVAKPLSLKNTILAQQWQNGRFLLPAMTRADLREAIERPAEARVMYFQPHSLVEQLIDEVSDMPGALPLLSFALSELYLKYLKRQQDADNSGLTIDRALSAEDYQNLGGVIQSLTQRADEEYETLVAKDPAYRQIIRHVMLRMVAIGGGEIARRRVLLSELNYPPRKNELVKTVIEQFTAARLLVQGKDSEGNPYVEPAHDALVRGWQKLLSWKQEDEESLLLQRRLTPAAQEWKAVKTQEKSSVLSIKGDSAFDWIDRILLSLENIGYIVPAQIAKRITKLWPQAQKEKAYSNQKNTQFLWNSDPYLAVLDKQLKSDNDWFNQIEAEFVQKSVVQKQKNSRWRWRIAAAVMLALSGLTIASLIGQRNTLISQAQSSQKSAQANLRANQSLDGMVESLQAAQALQHPLVQNPILRLGSTQQLQQLHKQIEGTLQWAIYRVEETNRMTNGQSTIVRSVTSPDRAVSTNPNNKIIAGAGENGRIDLWDWQGKPLQSWQEKSLRVWNVDFTPDGQVLASSGEDGIARLWALEDIPLGDMSSGDIPSEDIKLEKEIAAHQGYVRYVRFSPDGKMLATTGGLDGMLNLWDLQGNPLAAWRADNVHAKTVDFHPRHAQVVTIGNGGTIKIWDLEAALSAASANSVVQPLQTFSFFGWGAYFSPDGKHLVAAGNDGSIRVWAEQNQRWSLLKAWPAHEGPIWNVAFSPDSQHIVSAGDDSNVKIWNVQGQLFETFQGHTGPVRSVRFTAEGQQLVSSGDDGTTRLWDFVDNVLSIGIGFPTENHDTVVEQIMLDSQGNLVAISSQSQDGTITLEEITPSVNLPEETTFSEFNEITISPDRTLLASASRQGVRDNGIYIWDLVTGERLNTFRDHVGEVSTIRFSSDSKQLVSAGEDHTIRVWTDIAQKGKGRYRSIFQVYEEASSGIASAEKSDHQITGAIFSPDNQRLISSDNAGYIRFWDLNQNQQTALWQAHHRAITALDFSSENDTTLLATIGEDSTLQIPLEPLDTLIKKSCDRLSDFLDNAPQQSFNERNNDLCRAQ